MAGYRKLGRTSDQRKAMIRSQVTALLYHGKIRTTETRAKEIRKVAEGLVAMAVREKDNYETVKVTAKVARKESCSTRSLPSTQSATVATPESLRSASVRATQRWKF